MAVKPGLSAYNQVVLNTFLGPVGHRNRKKMAWLTKTYIYCVFGSVLDALGNKIREVMAPELAILNRMAKIMTVEAQGIPSCRQFLQRAKGVVEKDRQRWGYPQKL